MADVPMNMPLPGQPLTADLNCTRCGYNLRGLTLDKLCPECATPIARSVHGNLLRYADSDWVEKLRFGTGLMLWNMLIGVAVGGTGVVIMAIGLPPVLISLLTLTGGGLGLWAMFLITTPEPANALSEDPMTLRKLVRACAIVQFVGSVLQEACKTVVLGLAIAVSGGVMLLVGIVAHFGFFVYLRRFALRIPDDSLAAQTRTVMWGFVVGMTLVVAFAIVAVLAMGGTGGMGAGGTGGTISMGTGGTFNFSVTTTPVAPTTTATPAAPAAPATRPSPFAFMGLGVFGCGGAVAFLVFGIWYIVLLFRFHGVFRDAVRLGRQTVHTPTVVFARPVGLPTPRPEDSDRS